METRLSKVEAAVEHLKGDVAHIRTKVDKLEDAAKVVHGELSTLKERVDHLPSKSFIFGVTVAGLALIAGFIGYAEQIQALLN